MPPCPHCEEDRRQANHDVRYAISVVEEIEGLASDIPDDGQDFAESILQKSQDIGKNIEMHNRVTDGQISALENMLNGLRCWFHD